MTKTPTKKDFLKLNLYEEEREKSIYQFISNIQPKPNRFRTLLTPQIIRNAIFIFSTSDHELKATITSGI